MLTIFLDDGGVMNDNALRGPQWQRFLGDYFVPRLGGEHADWGRANHDTIHEMFGGGPWLNADLPFAEWERRYARDWLHGMTSRLGLLPPSDDDCVHFYRESGRLVTSQVKSAFPGVTAAIAELAARGHVLHCASGETSWELDGYLTSMGAREFVSGLYGADLAGFTKASPRYYASILAHSGVDPADALIVDDSPQALAWAATHGVRTALVGHASLPGFEPDLRVPTLADLPAALTRLA